MYSKRVCTNCGRELHPSQPYVRCCDADVCSEGCARERMKLIAKLDPTLTSPMSWPGTQSLTLQDSHLHNMPPKPSRNMRRSASSSHIMTPLREEVVDEGFPLVISTTSGPSAPTPPRGNIKKVVMCVLGCLGLALIALVFG